MTRQVTFDWQTNEDVYLHRAARHFSAVQDAAHHDASPIAPLSHPAFAYAAPSYAIYDDAPDAGAPIGDGERVLTLFALRALAVLLFALLAAGGAPMSPDQVDRAQIVQELTRHAGAGCRRVAKQRPRPIPSADRSRVFRIDG